MMSRDARHESAQAPSLDGAGLRIAIVVARFNSQVTARLLERALQCLSAVGVSDADVTVAWVPGAFEIPLAAQRYASLGDHDAVICLGCVIRGETAHFELVALQCAAGVMRVGLDTGRPVVFGVLATENIEQALARSDPSSYQDAGWEAAAVAVELVAQRPA